MADIDSNQGTKEQSFIASILFVEIAEYADLPVFEQIQHTSQMRLLVERCVVAAACHDLLIVDHEENIVLLFRGDPVDCFRLAKQMSEVLNDEASYREAPLHLGVNLGLVVMSKNELNMPIVNGPGVADAARAARAGLLREVLISRAYYAVLARVSKEHALLQYREFISDELDESFAIYQIAQPTTLIANAVSLQAIAPAARHPQRRYAVVSVVIALGAFAVYQNQRLDPPRSAALSQMIAPVVTESAQPIAAPIPSAATADTPTSKVAEIAAAVTFHHALQPTVQTIAQVKQTDAMDMALGVPVAKPAIVSLAIKPWGEVYIDGKKIGVTPPLHKIEISPGKRQIIVRNADFLPYRATFDIKPESLLQISHQFAK